MQALEFIKERNNLAPLKGPHHRHLKAFVGHWRIEGETGVGASRRPVSGEETYEWLEGGFFLVNRFDRQMGPTRFTGMGWISYDAISRSYLSYSISNSGFLKIYEVEISDHQMIFSGETERATIKLSPDRETLYIYWDECHDGTNWHSLCNLRGYLQRSDLVE